MIVAGADERFDLDEPVPVRMAALEGDGVELAVSRIDVGHSVVLFASMSTTAFADAAGRGCFHLDGEEPPPNWWDDTPVDLVLRLRDPVAGMFRDGDGIVAALFGPAETALRATESWYALEATQSVPVPGEPDATTAFGLRTRWADEL